MKEIKMRRQTQRVKMTLTQIVREIERQRLKQRVRNKETGVCVCVCVCVVEAGREEHTEGG